LLDIYIILSTVQGYDDHKNHVKIICIAPDRVFSVSTPEPAGNRTAIVTVDTVVMHDIIITATLILSAQKNRGLK
jgi:hypothetical protein